MIPTEDPSSPSPFDHQNSTLRSETDHHHHSTNTNKLSLVKNQEEVDLLKSPVHDSNPLPKFSIRDYVCSLRSKDIGASWPFSQKSLNICLKHGVTDVLPPFLSLDVLRDSSLLSRPSVHSSMPEKEAVRSCDEDLCRPADSSEMNPIVSLNPGRKVSSGSEEGIHFDTLPEADLPSKAKSSCLEEEKSEAELRRKVNSGTKIRTKKRKSTMKLNQVVEPVKSNGDFSPLDTTCMASEAVASNVCPVCKVFSSFSNTTLNAHIDQCLSGGPTMKWTSNSKAMPRLHKVKPRKMKSIVDIYRTARRCTLQQLDERNGTCWATTSHAPAQEKESREEEKEQRVLADDTGREEPVYVDTDGTKMRILSVPDMRTGDDGGNQKLIKGKKKLKFSEKKHHKSLKLVSRGQNFRSSKPFTFERRQRDREENVEVKGSCKEDRQKQLFKPKEPMEMEDLGASSKCASSKRRLYERKSSSQRDSLQARNKVANKSLSRSDTSSPGSSYGDGGSVWASSDRQISSSANSKGEGRSSFDAKVDEYRNEPILRKRSESCLKFTDGFAKSRLQSLPDKSLKKSREKGITSHNLKVTPNCTENRAFFPSSKAAKVIASSFKGSKSRKFSSLKKKLSSGRESQPESRINLKRKHLTPEKSRLDQLGSPSQDATTKEPSIIAEHPVGKRPFAMLDDLQTRKKKKLNVCERQESFVLKTSELADREIDSSVQFGSASSDGLVDLESPDIQTHGESTFLISGKSTSSEFQSFQPSSEDRDGMLYDNDIGKSLIRQNIESDYNEAGQGSYSAEFDSIPIPGPPGSFLPSPGREMVSDGHQGNSSSLTTSRIQSSENHHDVFDKNSLSDSHISAASTISPTLAKFDSRSSEKLSETCMAEQDEILVAGRSGSITEEENSGHVPPVASTGAERIDVLQERSGAYPRNELLCSVNDEPCRCSTKEIAAENTSLNNQELSPLRRRAVELGIMPTSLNSRPESLSFGGYQTRVPETKISLAVSADTEGKISCQSDSESAGLSSSKPVLRLMGKNLMVSKEDVLVESPELRNDQPSRQYSAYLGTPPVNAQNEDHYVFRPVFPQSPAVYQYQNDWNPQHYDVKLPSDIRGSVDVKTPWTPIYARDTMSPRPHAAASGFMQYGGCYGFGGSQKATTPEAVLQSQNNSPCYRNITGGSMNRNDSSFAYDGNRLCASTQPKEIIVIDDLPEHETDATEAMQIECMEKNRESLPSIPVMPYGYNTRYVSPSYSQSKHISSPNYIGSSLIGSMATSLRAPSRDVNASFANWNCAPEGLGPSSSLPFSPPASHMRSRGYFPPTSFS